MKKIAIFCLVLGLLLCVDGAGVWAIDVGWMQKGVRVWYFGAVGSATASDAEEAYLLSNVNGTDVQVTKHSGLNHWGTTNPVDIGTYSALDMGPCWIHPQRLQTLQSGDTWNFTLITGTNRNKNFEELMSPNSEVTEAGLIKITVSGVDQIKKIINLLPANTDILWVGIFYDVQVSDDTVYFSHPPKAIIDDLVEYCDDQNIHLNT